MKKWIVFAALFALSLPARAQERCRCEAAEEQDTPRADYLLRQPEPFCKARGHELKAADFIRQNETDSAAWHLEKAEGLYKQSACRPSQWLGLYRLRGKLHYLEADYQRALDYSLRALSILQENGPAGDQADMLLGIAQIFGRMGQTGKGLFYSRQALPLIFQLKEDPLKADLLNKAGSRYYFFFQDTRSPGLLDSARLFFTEALDVARKSGDINGMKTSYNKMNSLAFQEKKYTLALSYVDSALALSPGIINNARATSCGDKGNLLLKLGRFREAARWADSCLYYNLQLKFPPLIANAYSLVAEIADSLGDYRKAYEALYREKKITDSLQTAENARAVAEVERKYTQARNERTIRELRQQKQIYLLLGLAGVLVAGLLAFYFRQQSLKTKQQILETEQRLNRARMNPHFFFNALTALQQVALKENDGKTLASNLSKFSHIMRETLESTYKEYVTIRQELEFLKEYLEIQKLRFPRLFRYSLMVDGELDPSDVLLPSMILQPFVENCVEHGFAGIDYEGEVRVDFHREGNSLRIEIRDNGKGLAQPGAAAGEHISRASQIIKDRIYLLNIKLKTRADFSIDSNPGGRGVLVRIHLPLLYNS